MKGIFVPKKHKAFVLRKLVFDSIFKRVKDVGGTSFWHDSLVEGGMLKYRFNRLFLMQKKKKRLSGRSRGVRGRDMVLELKVSHLLSDKAHKCSDSPRILEDGGPIETAV